MESFDTSSLFDRARSEWFNASSDQSTEIAIGDGPHVSGDKTTIRDDLRKVLSGEADMGSDEIASSRLLPNSNGANSDALHILYGGLKEVFETSPNWKLIESPLRSICKFLNNRMLRWRFRA